MAGVKCEWCNLTLYGDGYGHQCSNAELAEKVLAARSKLEAWLGTHKNPKP